MKRIAAVFRGNLDNRKGATNATLSRIRHLQEALGQKVDVYCISMYDSWLAKCMRSKKVQKINTASRPESIEVDGISITMIWMKFSFIDSLLHRCGKKQICAGRFFDKISKKFSGYDLIMAHCDIPGSLAFTIYRKFNVPYTVTWHGSDINVEPHRGKYYYALISRILENATCNFFVSKALMDSSMRITRNAHSVLAYNGADESFRRYNDAIIGKLRSEFGLEDNDKVVGFVGNVIPIKNVMSLPKIFSIIERNAKQSVKFWIIGDGELRSNVEKEVTVLELKEKVRFWGNQPFAKMPDLMNCIDVLLLPSLNEGLPLVTVEAMKCGASVFGADVGGISEILGKENVVAHGDGFEEKMAQLACSALSEKPQQTVGNCFSWSNTACIEAGACRSILG